MNKRFTTTVVALGLTAALSAGLSCAPASAAVDPAPPVAAAPSQTAGDINVVNLMSMINNERIANGLTGPLTWNPLVEGSVWPWTEQVAANSVQPGFDPNQITKADEGASVLPAGFTTHLELVTILPTDPGAVQAWWDANPDLKAKILDPTVNTLGVIRTEIGSGPYAGQSVWLISLTHYDVQPTSSFTDITSSPFQMEIAWMKAAAISTGYADGSYKPLGTVNRDAMAAFMYRLAGSPAYTAPATSPFTDVAPTDQFYKEITWLASTGISTGYPNGDGTYSYHPLSPVNRDAMAAFMYRFASGLKGVSAASQFQAPSSAVFGDSQPGTQFYKEIAWMKAAGVSTGYGDGTYHNLAPVNRDAMAAFMYRLNGYLGANGATHL